eukprot:IDg12892t1
MRAVTQVNSVLSIEYTAGTALPRKRDISSPAFAFNLELTFLRVLILQVKLTTELFYQVTLVESLSMSEIQYRD